MGRFYLRKEKRVEFGTLVYGRSDELKKREKLDFRRIRKLEQGHRINGDYIPQIAKAIGWDKDIEQFAGAFFITEEMWQEQERARKRELQHLLEKEGADLLKEMQINYPDFYPYIFEGQEMLRDDPQYYAFRIFIERVLYYHKKLLSHKNDLSDGQWTLWMEGGLALIYNRSPVYQECVEGDPHYKDIREAIRAYLSQQQDDT